jgi:hypothetical protein
MTFFGPEAPKPWCAISEKYFEEKIDLLDSDLASDSQSDAIDDYDVNLCNTIKKYLDIDCMDDVLFVKCINKDNVVDNFYGDSYLASKGKIIKNWPKIFEKKFCLVKPIHMCQISCSDEDQSIKYTYYKIITKYETSSCTGSSKFKIETEIIEPIKYDKIIVKNCLKFYENDFKGLCNLFLNLFKTHKQLDNSLLIIQRIADLNTLPFYSKVISKKLYFYYYSLPLKNIFDYRSPYS